MLGGRTRSAPIDSSRRPAAWPHARSSGTRRVAGFVVRFAAGWLAALLLLSLAPSIDHWGVRGTLATLVLLARLVGLHTTLNGDVIQLGKALPLQVVPDCTPLLPTVALWAAIAAYPARFAWKLAGAACGAIFLWIYNLARILLLILILGWNRIVVNFIHVYLWQTITVIVICAFFMGWIWQGQRRRAVG